MELIKAVQHILEQLKYVTENLNNGEFSKPLLSLNNSTIGQHTRHTLEFFTCLQKGIGNGKVNYDNREHNHEIESDILAANSCMHEIQTNLKAYHNNLELILEGSYSADGSGFFSIPTNLFRELAYNIEHAVHHMAIIKIGLAEIKPALELPAHFGVAVSTVRYQKSSEENA